MSLNPENENFSDGGELSDGSHSLDQVTTTTLIPIHTLTGDSCDPLSWNEGCGLQLHLQ